MIGVRDWEMRRWRIDLELEVKRTEALQQYY
jgi:hypothetical protein